MSFFYLQTPGVCCVPVCSQHVLTFYNTCIQEGDMTDVGLRKYKPKMQHPLRVSFARSDPCIQPLFRGWHVLYMVSVQNLSPHWYMDMTDTSIVNGEIFLPGASISINGRKRSVLLLRAVIFGQRKYRWPFLGPWKGSSCSLFQSFSSAILSESDIQNRRSNFLEWPMSVVAN